MQRESSKEFQRGVGRARALLRQCFAHWPGVPVECDSHSDGTTVQWFKWPAPATEHAVRVDGQHVREVEQALSRLIHHHHEHLVRVLPNADDWLLRASNCLDLLKEFLYKPPAEQPIGSKAIEKMAISERWKRKLTELWDEWPKLRPLCWHLSFIELTSLVPETLECLPWVQQHAQSLSDVMRRDDGLRVAMLLARVGTNLDARWLKTVFEFLNDPVLANTRFEDSFAHADTLAQALRDSLRQIEHESPVQKVVPTLGEKFVEHLELLLPLKPSEIEKITRLVGAVAGDDLSELARTLHSRARGEEKRLTKEHLKLRHLGVQYYEESIGRQNAHSQAHVITNLREEGRSLLTLFDLAEWLCNNPRVARKLEPAVRFFEHVSGFRVANRIHLASEWQRAGWIDLVKLLPALNELIARRGIHSQLKRHWLRRFWPSISSQMRHLELLQAGRIFTDNSGWRRVVQLLELLVYDANERLTEESVTALVKLAQAAPDVETAFSLWKKLTVDLLANADLEGLRHAFWFTDDANELRMVLVWFSLNERVQQWLSQIRGALKGSEHLGLLKRLIEKRDLTTIERLRESIEFLESFGTAIPERIASSTDQSATAWIAQYPSTFHSVLTRLAQVTNKAERIAQDLLDGHWSSADKIRAEIQELGERLSNDDWRLEQSPARIERIGKRLDNLNRQLASPRAPSLARQGKLIEKLSARIDRELLADVAALAQEKLRLQLGAIAVEGLYEKLKRPPYDRILPAIARLKTAEQQLAWRALGSSWDNSLKLLSEPANEKFLKEMTKKGLVLDNWLSSEFSLTGKRADGTPYRVAFTHDPLDILLMGHHFQTCLGLESMNFFSTVSNLVDANKRVVYGLTSERQVVGRCLFALTGQGRLQTFTRYEHAREDGFAALVDEFAERLAVSMNTTLTEHGHVPCLVSQNWYDDGCMAVPSSMKGKAIRFLEAVTEDRERDPWELALEIFESKEALICDLNALYQSGVFYDVVTMKSWLPHLANVRQVALGLRLRMAARVWYGGSADLARTVFEGLTNREIARALGRETAGSLIEERGFAELMVDRDPYLARQLLRRSRPNHVRSDEQEDQMMRRHMRDLIVKAIRSDT